MGLSGASTCSQLGLIVADLKKQAERMMEPVFIERVKEKEVPVTIFQPV